MKQFKFKEPNEELKRKIQDARNFIINKEKRDIKCHNCEHVILVAYTGSVGCVEIKCKKCGHKNIVDLINMRKLAYSI